MHAGKLLGALLEENCIILAALTGLVEDHQCRKLASCCVTSEVAKVNVT